MGIISINGLKMLAHHGVFEQERLVGNEFEINVSLNVPSSERAMSTDSLDDTINYADVIEIVKEEMTKPSKLIEAVAGRIKDKIVQRFGNEVVGGTITVAKLAPPVKAQLDSVSYTCKW